MKPKPDNLCWDSWEQVRAHNHNLWVDKQGNPKAARTDSSIIDAPWTVHLPKICLWAAAEADKATAVILLLLGRAPTCLCFALLGALDVGHTCTYCHWVQDFWEVARLHCRLFPLPQ